MSDANRSPIVTRTVLAVAIGFALVAGVLVRIEGLAFGLFQIAIFGLLCLGLTARSLLRRELISLELGLLSVAVIGSFVLSLPLVVMTVGTSLLVGLLLAGIFWVERLPKQDERQPGEDDFSEPLPSDDEGLGESDGEENADQQWTRHRDPSGRDCLEGTVSLRFPAGSVTEVLHLPVVPAMSETPEVRWHLIDREDVRIRVGECRSYGVSLQARRRTAAESEDVVTLHVELIAG